MFKSKIFYIFLVAVIIGFSLFYKNYRVSQTNNEIAYFMQTTLASSSHPGANNSVKDANVPRLFGLLTITSGIPNSQEMANGLLCVENAKALDKVDLYMPDMGHGSEPPKVTVTQIPKEFIKYSKNVIDFGCYSVESMQLFMPGFWQVRVFYKDGRVGLFVLDLKK